MKSVLSILSLLLILFACAPSKNTIECEDPRVVDGDTLRCSNLPSSVRIIPSIDDPSLWFDTPETSKRHAKCQSEIILGKRAKQAFKTLIKNSPLVTITPTKDSQKVDRFGRYLMRVNLTSKSNRKVNYAEHMNSLNLGITYPESEHPYDWCNQKEFQ